MPWRRTPAVGALASPLRSYEVPPQPARAGVLVSGRDGSPRPREHASDLPSVHWRRPHGRDRPHHGAVDDASGTSALIELARAYSGLGQRPARSILFLATTGATPWHHAFLGYIIPALIGNIIGGLSLVAAINHAQVVS